MRKNLKNSRKLVSIIAASSAGTLIEWYDFFLFGSLASIISTEFFPKENPAAAFLATLATFSAGLVVRPFGALIFGRLGDMIGRKHTFMVTLGIMGFSTVSMGLVPGYDSIGFLAPMIVLVLRLLQGMALGGEYGGATTYVAEQAPVNRRGFFTSWIQSTTGLAFILSISVILLVKNLMNETHWLEWGWRIPFLASVVLVAVSIYIRTRMSESPLFARAKSAGKTSKNPLKESFGNKENLKMVLLAFFGLTIGGGVIGWVGFYAQGFLLKTVMIDYDQANEIIITGILMGLPFFFFFGWLSDKIGRKVIMMAGMVAALVAFRPIFSSMYNASKVGDKVLTHIQTSTSHQEGTSYLITTSIYDDGTVLYQKQEDIPGTDKRIPELHKTVTLSVYSKWKLILLNFLLEIIFTMAYAPMAAFLVEMFPLKIRYTSLSLPYHLGFGIFGGLSPYFATYFVDKAAQAGRGDYYLAGLIYPLVMIAMSVLVGMLYIRENDPRYRLDVTNTFLLNSIRKWLGILWIMLALVVVWYGFMQAGIPKILSGKQEDIVFGFIITVIITPVAACSLFFFGKYALEGAYKQ